MNSAPEKTKGRICPRCGTELRYKPNAHIVEVAVSLHQKRSIEVERTISNQATLGINSNLGKHAEQRADPGPLRSFHSRDYALEGLEEGADWRNYIVWGIWQTQQDIFNHFIDCETGHQKIRLLTEALRHVAEAYNLTEEARKIHA